MTSTDAEKIAAVIAGLHLTAGLGTKENACSIGAINLAMTGELTDRIPDCMSEVIGRWIIDVQDAMPDKMRNSDAWRQLLPLAAGTGREHEVERGAIILEWMWSRVLPSFQPRADRGGFGKEWLAMTSEKTPARAAAVAARAAWAADTADAAAVAVRAAWAADTADAADAAAWASAAAVRAAWAADTADAAAWQEFDPCSLLERLIAVGGAR